jgi:hypothetical protein
VAIPYQAHVASLGHQQVFVPASFVANSISVLNPNNGVTYVARNRDCISTTPGAWDWKVPSQSYAYLPGPFQSVGLFYVDQSGGAIPGDISVYASQQTFDLPSFQAIGLTLASVVTTLDIGTGNQPAPPAANNIRLWADGSGHLHILSATGTDNVIYDASNIGTVALGGDLTGTISNASIAMRNNSYQYARDASNTSRVWQGVGSDNIVRYFNVGASLIIWESNAGAGLATLDNVGNFTAGAALVANSNATIGFSNGQTIGWNASYGFVFSSNVYMGGPTLYFASNPGLYVTAIGSALETSVALLVGAGASNSPGAMLAIAARVGPQICLYDAGAGSFFGFGINSGELSIISPANTAIRANNNSGGILWSVDPSGNMTVAGSQIVIAGAGILSYSSSYFRPNSGIAFPSAGTLIAWPNGSYISGSGYVQGSAPALKYSLATVDDNDLLALVADPRMPVNTYLFPDVDRRNIGFMADDVAEVLTDFVIRDDNGAPAGYVSQELTHILWGAVRALKAQVDDITAKLPA